MTLKLRSFLRDVEVSLEHLHPGVAAADMLEVLPDQPEVQDVQGLLDVLGAHAHLLHLPEQGVAGLFQGDVDAGRPVLLGLVVQHVVGQRGLHGAGGAGHENDVPLGDAPLQYPVEAFDVGLNPAGRVQSESPQYRVSISAK